MISLHTGVGAIPSITVIVKSSDEVLPHASSAVIVSVCSPIGNPGAGIDPLITSPTEVKYLTDTTSEQSDTAAFVGIFAVDKHGCGCTAVTFADTVMSLYAIDGP